MNTRAVIIALAILALVIIGSSASQMAQTPDASESASASSWMASGTRAELEEQGYRVESCIPEITVCRVKGRIAVQSADQPAPTMEPVVKYRIQGGDDGTSPKASDSGLATSVCTAGQYHHAKIGTAAAWAAAGQGAGVTVAVIDTGVSPHPDLVIITGTSFAGGPGYADLVGHGTHVAGLVAARRSASGCTYGVAPAANIMPVRVLGADGSGDVDNIAAGIVWAVDHGAQVINLSLGGPSASFTLQRALQYAVSHGVLAVCAAGNDGKADAGYPAKYAECLSVAATDQADHLASFSNYGPFVNVAAPGYSILSTLRNGGYGYMSGTSMATPLVSGEGALLAGRGITGTAARADIVQSSDPIPGAAWLPGTRIDAANAAVTMLPAPTAIAPGAHDLRCLRMDLTAGAVSFVPCGAIGGAALPILAKGLAP